MNRHLVSALPSAPRRRGLAVAASITTVLVIFCVWMAQLSVSTWHEVLEPGPATLDEAIAALAATLAGTVALWMLGALLVSVVAAWGAGAAHWGTAASGVARLVAPLVVRNAVAALLGVAVLASPAAADASSGPPAERSSTSRLQSYAPPVDPLQRHLSPAWTPTARPPSTSTSPTSTSPLSSDLSPARTDLHPGWTPSPPRTRPSASARGPERVPIPVPIPGRAQRLRVDPDDTVTVRRGDTLWDLAARHLGPGADAAEIADAWPHWFTANRRVIGSDPDHLLPGMLLRVPERSSTTPPPRFPQEHSTRQSAR